MSKSDNLTRAEAAFLRSENVPAAIRAYAEERPDQIALRTSAYRKVAAAARAERDALVEVAALHVVRAHAERRASDTDHIAHLETENGALRRELERTTKRLTAATAAPALAVYAEGTGR